MEVRRDILFMEAREGVGRGHVNCVLVYNVMFCFK